MTSRHLSLAAFFAFTAFAPAQQSGLTYERWNNLSGPTLETLRQDGINTRSPDYSGTVTLAQAPSNAADNHGARLRGFLTAPATGDYTFFIAGDDNVELWLSQDPSGNQNFDTTAPWNRRLIAWHRHATSTNQWNKYPTQKSRVIRLEQGVSYYMEALVKEHGGADHLSIGWHSAPSNPTFSTHNFQSPVTATWQAQANSTTTFSVLSGDMTGTADRASLHAREWTGDGEFIIHLPAMQAGSQNAKAGLMLRESSAIGSRHAYICRAWYGQGLSFQRRTATDGSTSSTHRESTSWEWLRLVRSGNTITASASFDGQSWLEIGSATYTDLAASLLVGPAASSYSSTVPVTGTFGALESRPLVATEIIPGTHLTTFTPHAADPLNRGLPDAWLAQNGLDPSGKFGSNGPHGDPDGDGRDNFTEFRNGLAPTTPDSIPGGLTRETWTNLTGTHVSDLTHNRSRFLAQPNERVQVSGVHEINSTTYYGSRYRGALIAPTTGWYRFWISGDNEAEFWFADGTVKLPANLSQPVHRTTNPAVIPATNRYGKQLLAHIHDERFGSDFTGDVHDFDQFPSQRSRSVYLTQGQSYYLEVLHKQSSGAGHISLAWQAPGSTRQIIPAHVLTSEIHPADDPDGDNLPSPWETPLYGFDPANNGLTAIHDGQYADPDGDGLANLLELQYGTNPNSADTDQDTFSDHDEIFRYGTDPIVSNNLQNTPIADQPVPHQYTSATGGWTANSDGTLSAADRRGEITYTFNTAKPGAHEIILTGSAIGDIRPSESLPISLSLNGALIANKELVSENGAPGTLRAITPLIAAGTHTLTILHDNYRTARRLKIHSIEVIRLGGDDLDGNDLPDWIEQNSQSANALTRISTTSRTSPLSIEGRTQNLATAALTYTPPAATAPLTLTSQQGLISSINDSFFADIHLRPDGQPTTLSASFLGGTIPVTNHATTWIPTNLFEFNQSELHIRQGDSLRLDAWSGQQPDSQPYQIFLNNQSFVRYNQSNPPDTTDLVSGGWGSYRGFSIRFDDTALDTAPAQPANAPLRLQQLVIRRSATSSGTPLGDPANAILKIYTSQTPSSATWVADSTNTQDVSGGISETNLTFTFASLSLSPSTKYWFHFANTPGALPTNEITWTNARLRISNHAVHTFASGNLVNASWGNQDTAYDPLIAASFATPVANAAQATTHSSGTPVVAAFQTPGTHTLTALHGGQSSTVILHVHAADFGPAHSVRAYSPRPWTPTLLGPTHLVEADDRITLAETTVNPATGPRTFQAAVHQASDRHVIARLPADVQGAPSAILARGTVQAFYLAYLDETSDPEIIHRYDDGTWLMRGTMVAVNLPPDILIRLTTILQGTVFHNGSNTLWLDRTHFNANGIATIYYEWAGTGEPRLCNRLYLFGAP